MKKTLMLALIGAALTFAFVGCSPTQEASSTNPASMTEGTTASEKVACAACGHEVDKSAIKEVDGKMLCVNCAEKTDSTHSAEMIDCKCGMQVAKSEAVEVNSAWYCAACAEKMQGDVPTEGGHGPDDGHGH